MSVRTSLLNSGSSHCKVYGTVSNLNKKNDYLLLKKVTIYYTDTKGARQKSRESHLWLDKKAFNQKQILQGDCVSFAGKIYMYTRQNSTIDFGVKNITNLSKVVHT